MRETVHYFTPSNERGKLGENLLKSVYPFLIPDGCDGHDFIDGRNGKTIEVKTDFYHLIETPNAFIERYSNDKDYKFGGPYRALQYNTGVYLYQYIKDRTIMWFDNIAKLVEVVESYVKKYNPELKRVKNNGYVTLGYAIPRKVLEPLAKVFTLGAELPIN